MSFAGISVSKLARVNFPFATVRFLCSATVKKDYYSLLNVSEKAASGDIKKAYYQLAKKFHPDVIKSSASQKHFALISEAFEVLSDPSNRKSYNEFLESQNTSQNNIPENEQIESETKLCKEFEYVPKYSPEQLFRKVFNSFSFSSTGDTENVFSSLDKKKKEIDVTVSFAQAAAGSFETVEVSNIEQNCVFCGGKGRIVSSFEASDPATSSPCDLCQGQGRLVSDQIVTLQVPSGVQDGELIRKEVGLEEVYFKIHITPSLQLSRYDSDVVSTVEISPTLAVLGGYVYIEGLYKQLKVLIPRGCSSHQYIRVENEGFPLPSMYKGKTKGDHLAEVIISVPENVTDELKVLASAFASFDKSYSGDVDGINLSVREVALSPLESKLDKSPLLKDMEKVVEKPHILKNFFNELSEVELIKRILRK